MRFGICRGFDALPEITGAGADYIECTVTGLMKMTDGELRRAAEANAASPVKCEALCILFPGSQIPLTGERFYLDEIEKYLRGAFKRVSGYLSPKLVVLGSGGARNCPEGFDRRRALEQFTEAARLTAETAGEYGFTIALEPLNRKECNIINSLADGMEIVKAAGLENFKLLADIYHMLEEGEPPEAILACEGFIAHTHVASKRTRLYPQEKDRGEIAPYFQALKKIGYDAGMSIEAGLNGTLKDSFKLLRALQ